MQEHSYGIIPFFKKDDSYQFLIIKHNAGHRGFPKGHKESHETNKETAIRELREETGIEEVEIVSDKELIQEYSFHRQWKGMIYKRNSYFLGKIQESDISNIHIQKEEIADYFIGPLEAIAKRLSDIRTDKSQTTNRLLDEIKEFLSDSSQ